MPYELGEKGTHGCSGYPVVKIATGEVMGCHPTAKDAGKQLAALHINEPNANKADGPNAVNPSSTANPTYPSVGIKYPTYLTTARRNKGVVRKPKKKNSGGNGQDASGAFSSGGPGGSMGAS
jgi:hypothetical protein